MLVKLKEGLAVAAEDVGEVSVNYEAYVVTVRMKNGVGHCLSMNRNDRIFEVADLLMDRINAAIGVQHE